MVNSTTLYMKMIKKMASAYRYKPKKGTVVEVHADAWGKDKWYIGVVNSYHNGKPVVYIPEKKNYACVDGKRITMRRAKGSLIDYNENMKRLF